MGALIAVLNKKGENATEAAVTMLEALVCRKIEAVGIASPTNVRIGKTIRCLHDKEVKSHLIIGHVLSKILDLDELQPGRLKNATLVFEGRTYLTPKMPHVKAVAERPQYSPEEMAKTLVKENEGDFAFAIAESERLIAGRDAMGARPLYYGENPSIAALASERKALWKVGINRTESFPPGHVAFIDKNGFKLKPIRTLPYSKPRKITLQAAAKELQTLLQHSVRERVSGLREVAVAFSGGLDSSIVAYLANRSGVDVHLIYVSLENRLETEHARKVAEELKLPIRIHLFREEDVETTVPEVISLLEESDPVKTSIGIPFYWVAEKAAEAGFDVMLAGQGADEFFGGYRRYTDDYLMYGSEEARKRIFDDVAKIYKTNLEGDFKICNFHNVELRLPFAAYRLAEFTVGLPVELKIGPAQDTLRKLVLRRAAQNFGLPEFVVTKPKKAIQYATGISKVLRKLAKKKGATIGEYVRKTFQKTFDEMK